MLERQLLPGVLLALAVLAPVEGPASETPSAAGADFFEEHIRPLLAEHCYGCHSARSKRLRGGLRLDTRDGWLEGGDLGPAVTPGDPADSLLIVALSHEDELLKMPPSGKLADDQIALLDPLGRDGRAGSPRGRRGTADRSGARDRRRARPGVLGLPPAGGPAGPRGRRRRLAPQRARPVHPRRAGGAGPRAGAARRPADPDPPGDLRPDRPAAHAPRRSTRSSPTTIRARSSGSSTACSPRRPTASGGAGTGSTWPATPTPTAWTRTSPTATPGATATSSSPPSTSTCPTTGSCSNSSPATCSPRPTRRAERHRRLIATGFLALGPKVLAEVDERKMEMDIVDEQIDTVGRTFLGLTLGCARCHDHKFDPISTADYYALAGIFKSTRTMETFTKVARWHENSLASEEDLARKAAHDREVPRRRRPSRNSPAHGRLSRTGSPGPRRSTPRRPRPSSTGFARSWPRWRAEAPELPSAMGVTEGTVADAHDPHPRQPPDPGRGRPQAGPGGVRHAGAAELRRRAERPAGAGPLDGRRGPPADRSRDGQPALALALRPGPGRHARQLRRARRAADPPGAAGLAGPPLRRGRLVDQGDAPAHHALEHLPDGSNFDPAAARVDPENRLLWRMDVRRLEAEAIRDALLAVGGTLDRRMGGSLLEVENRAYFFDHTSQDATDYDSPRRSVYLPVVRNHLYDMFQLFDATDASVTDGDRATTTVAPQALFLMNSDLAVQAARDPGRPPARSPGSGRRPARIRLLYETAYGRPPSTAESERAAAYLARFDHALRDSDEGGRCGGGWPRRLAGALPGDPGVERIRDHPLGGRTSRGSLLHPPALPSPDAPRGRRRLRLARLRRPAGRGPEGRRRARRAVGRSAGAAAAALPGPGEAGHLPVHEGRAVARRHLRRQAAAPPRPRQAPAVREAPGPVRPDRQAAGLALEVPADTARAGSPSASCSRTWPGASTTSACSTRSTAPTPPTAGRC